MNKNELQVLFPVTWNEVSAVWYEIRVEGPEQNGSEFDQNRANAALLLGRILFRLEEKTEYVLSELESRSVNEAAPNTASMLVGIAGEDEPILLEAAAEIQGQLREEYLTRDGELSVLVERQEVQALPALHPVDLQKLVFYLVQVPDGVQKPGRTAEEQPDTWCCLTAASLLPDGFHAGFCVAGRVESAGMMLLDKICYLTEFLGGEILS